MLPFKAAGTIPPADEAEPLLGSSTAHSCCCSKCQQQGPRAALGNEGKPGQILDLGVLHIKGQRTRTTSGVLDRCDRWLQSKVNFCNNFCTFGPVQYIQGCDAPQSLLLPGCSPLVYYHVNRALCQTVQNKHKTSLQKWMEDAGLLYQSKKSRPTSSSHMIPLPVASSHPSCARHHVQKLKASIRSPAKQTHTQTSPCQEADNIFFSLFHGFQIQLALFLWDSLFF